MNHFRMLSGMGIMKMRMMFSPAFCRTVGR